LRSLCNWCQGTARFLLIEYEINAMIRWLQATVVGRSQSPTMHFPVSPLEKTDAQILLIRVGFTPESDTRSINVGGDLRPQEGTRYNRQLAKKNRSRHLLVIMNERIINSA
jgi:hypothetical protein